MLKSSPGAKWGLFSPIFDRKLSFLYHQRSIRTFFQSKHSEIIIRGIDESNVTLKSGDLTSRKHYGHLQNGSEGNYSKL